MIVMTIPEFLNKPILQAPTKITSNFLNPKTWEVTQQLNEVIEPLKTIARFLDYIFNPSKILFLLWNWTLNISYWVCLFIALFALISYILGVKKYGKYLPWSIGIYTLIQAIGSVVK